MRRHRTILYVGDDAEVRTLLTAVFAAMGYEFVALNAGQLEPALAEPRSHVVLIDVGSPSNDAIKLSGNIQDRHPGTPVIMLAREKDVSPTSINAMRSSRAEALFYKPLMRTEELVACVTEAFRKLERWQAVVQRAEAS